MGTILSIAGHQGGSGKTTTTLNLGLNLAHLGNKVLLIDSDPRGALAKAAGLTGREAEQGLVQILRGRDRQPLLAGSSHGLPLDLLANGSRQPADAFFLGRQARQGGLGRIIAELAGQYDYTLIDTPSTIEAISAMVFAQCHHVLLALPCRHGAVKTLPGLLRLLKQVKDRLQPHLDILGILATKVDNQNPYELDVLATIRLSFPEGLFFSTLIPRSGHFERAASHCLPLALQADNNEISHLYSHLAQEVVTRLLASKQ